MDSGRLIYRLTEAYVVLLAIGAVVTVVWLYVPRIAASPTLAGLWFAIGGFGALVAVTVILAQRGRNSPQEKRRDRERQR